MSLTLTQVAQTLKDANKKVQLIYAFNGAGKTRLSREFKELIAPKNPEETEEQESGIKILYYNAFTEDLFYWDNDLDGDINRKLKIHPNAFTDLALNFLKDQGQDINIATHFQKYTNRTITPIISPDFSEVTFSIQGGNENILDNIKISRGEESNFIWCVFYSLVEQIISVLNILELDDRSTDKFNNLEYIFIDDPVSSLDENHLIELAVNIAELIKMSTSNKLKFIIATHNPLFYNVLFSELNAKTCYMLNRLEDNTHIFSKTNGGSNKDFSYHLFLKKTIKEAIDTNSIEKYHFSLLRNLYEKTASFLGYQHWQELLPDDKHTYYNRIVQFTNHSTLSNVVVREPTDAEKQTVVFLFEHLTTNYNYYEENDTI